MEKAMSNWWGILSRLAVSSESHLKIRNGGVESWAAQGGLFREALTTPHLAESGVDARSQSNLSFSGSGSLKSGAHGRDLVRFAVLRCGSNMVRGHTQRADPQAGAHPGGGIARVPVSWACGRNHRRKARLRVGLRSPVLYREAMGDLRILAWRYERSRMARRHGHWRITVCPGTQGPGEGTRRRRIPRPSLGLDAGQDRQLHQLRRLRQGYDSTVGSGLRDNRIIATSSCATVRGCAGRTIVVRHTLVGTITNSRARRH